MRKNDGEKYPWENSLRIYCCDYSLSSGDSRKHIVSGKVTQLTDQVNRNWDKLSLVQGLTDKIRTADELGARYVMSNTDDERNSYLAQYEEMLPLIENAITELESARLSEAELKGVTELKSKWNDYLIVLKEAFALAKEGNFPEAQRNSRTYH